MKVAAVKKLEHGKIDEIVFFFKKFIKKKHPSISRRAKILSVNRFLPKLNTIESVDKKIKATKPTNPPNNFEITLSEIIKKRIVMIGPR